MKNFTQGKKGASKIIYLVALFVVIAALVGFFLLNQSKQETCGNGVCGAQENCFVCARDCKCAGGETCSPQEKRCVKLKPSCGDGTCDESNGESCGSCPQDCGACPTQNLCGNGICDAGEDADNCAIDCKKPAQKACGNGIADPGENCYDCPQDVKCQSDEYCSPEEKKCIRPLCGNEKCDFFENPYNCCLDCACQITGETCNKETRSCEMPSVNQTDARITELVTDYYDQKGQVVESMEIKQEIVFAGTLGRKVELRIKGQEGLRAAIVTEDGKVMELPIF